MDFQAKMAQIRWDSYQNLKKKYDYEAGMPAVRGSGDTSHSYHSRLNGAVLHPLRQTSLLAMWVYDNSDAEFYPEAERMLENLIRYQDTDPDSPTFGLWAYYAEEKLADMFNPDYNWANFIGKELAMIVLKHPDKLSRPMLEKLPAVIERAAECSIRRNAAPDYTNIAVMSSLFIYTAGAICKNDRIREEGRSRIQLLYDYFMATGQPSEYNSSTYTPLAIGDLSDFLPLIADAELHEKLAEINRILCRCLVKHYNPIIRQLSAPQYRAYSNYGLPDRGEGVGGVVYRLSKEKSGYLPSEGHSLICDLPEEEFEFTGERWICEPFYRKNGLRTPEDTNIIISDCDCGDLYAFSYLTERYNIGSLDGCDTWNQRRNCMVTWGEKYLRLRGIKDEYDFCSGFVAASQYKNVILGRVGFTTDRGDMHYILDKERGFYTAKQLKFVFELGGKTEKVQVTEIPGGAVYYDPDDGVRITVKTADWVFDGQKAEVRLNPDTKNLEMIAFDSERSIAMCELSDCYGSFTMEVQSDTVEPRVSYEGGYAVSECTADGRTLRVGLPMKPMTYNEMMRARRVTF